MFPSGGGARTEPPTRQSVALPKGGERTPHGELPWGSWGDP